MSKKIPPARFQAVAPAHITVEYVENWLHDRGRDGTVELEWERDGRRSFRLTVRVEPGEDAATLGRELANNWEKHLKPPKPLTL